MNVFLIAVLTCKIRALLRDLLFTIGQVVFVPLHDLITIILVVGLAKERKQKKIRVVGLDCGMVDTSKFHH